MVNVVFVAPFFLDTTLRFVDAAASLPDVRLGLVSQDPEEKLPKALRSKLAGHYRVEDGVAVDSRGRAPRDAEGVRLRRPHSGLSNSSRFRWACCATSSVGARRRPLAATRRE
jgi:hypothetical protein